MASALVCMIRHQIRPMVSHEIWPSSNHGLTKLLYCMVSQSWEDIELVLKFVMTLTYEWDPKLVICSLWIRSLLINVGDNKYSQ